MTLVFCGTPEFAVPSLRALLGAGHRVALVLTQPDRPAGRKLALQPPPVKQLALAHDLPVEQPETLKHNLELRARLEALAPDAIIVVAYGRILPPWMLALPPLGCLNVHGSLLPRYRGAAPIQWAVANGETVTGVTTMRLDAGLDTGDTLLFHSLPFSPHTTSEELYPQLAELGAALLLETLRGLEAGTLHPTPQDHAQATLAPLLTREDGRLDPVQHTALTAYNRWRGFAPWPGCWATLRGRRFLLHRLHPLPAENPLPTPLRPGELLFSTGELLLGMAQGTALVLDEVQLEAKPRLSGALFARDFQLRPGESLA